MAQLQISFGSRIKALRHELGATVRQLADMVDKSPAYISKVETRGEIPSPQLIFKFSEVFKAGPEELLELAREDLIERKGRQIQQRYEEALSLYRRSR